MGHDVTRLEKIVRFVNEKGLCAHFHATGDGAIQTAVDAICAAVDEDIVFNASL